MSCLRDYKMRVHITCRCGYCFVTVWNCFEFYFILKKYFMTSWREREREREREGREEGILFANSFSTLGKCLLHASLSASSTCLLEASFASSECLLSAFSASSSGESFLASFATFLEASCTTSTKFAALFAYEFMKRLELSNINIKPFIRRR